MPRRETIERLVDKFESVTLEETLKITQEDKLFCEKLQEQFEAAIAKLNVWSVRLSELKKELGNPEFISIEIRPDGSKSIDDGYFARAESVKHNPFSIYDFSADYGILFIEKSMDKAADTLSNSIVNYFGKKYGLNIPKPPKFFKLEGSLPKEIVSYKKVVTHIIDSYGGMDLTLAGVESLRDAFRRKVWKKEHIKVSPNKLSIDNFIYYTKDYNGLSKLDYRTGMETMSLLRRVFSFFETEQLSNISNILNINTATEIDFSAPIEFLSFSKIESLKLYKNGKIDIKFYDNGVAQEFFDVFELDKIKRD